MILQKPELFNDFELVKGRMDDVFLNVTGNKLPGGESVKQKSIKTYKKRQT